MAAHPTPTFAPEREPLSGFVERVTFHNPDSGFCVLRVKVRGHCDLATVIGHAPSVAVGEYVQASGTWEHHREHGRQFRAAFMKATAPDTFEGIEKYLGSGMIRGIGPVHARKLVRAFGERVFEVIEQAPARLREVPGIGPRRAERIAANWPDQKAIRGIMDCLQSHGVGTARAVRIYKTYGADAVPLISENPYRLARDIRGIGFKSADAIAERLGIPRTSMIRARAGISYALMEAVADGHCALPADELLRTAEALLEIPQATLAEALDLELVEGTVVADEIGGTRCIFLAHLWRAERTVAEILGRLVDERPPWPAIDPGRAIPWVEGRLGVSLAGLTPASLLAPVPLGITLGLFLGKQVGVMGATWIAVRLRWSALPEGTAWPQVYGMSLLTGIGFTMSLFIGTLAFEGEGYSATVRIGVLTGSLLSAVAGYLVLILTPARAAATA